MSTPLSSMTTVTQAPPLNGFVSLAKEYCKEHGLGLAFQKDVKRYFLKTLGRSFWEPVRSYMTETEWPVVKACKAAGLDPSTHTRWDEMIPTFETICLLFARCDLNMNEVKFPGGYAAFKKAFFKTIEHIRAKHLNQPGQLDDEMFECVRQVLVNPVVLSMIEGASSDDGSELSANFTKAADAIADTVKTRFPGGRIQNGAAVQQAIDEWLIPWVLLYHTIPAAQGGC